MILIFCIRNGLKSSWSIPSLIQDLGVQPERLVGNDEDGVDGSAAERVHEPREAPVDLALAAADDREGRDAVSQPLDDLVVPILKIRFENWLNRPAAGFLGKWRILFFCD